MHNRKAALVALILVQLFYGLTYTFANDVIVGGYIKPFGFILIRVLCGGILFWLFGLVTPTKKIDPKAFPKLIAAAFFGVALNMLAFFKGLEYTTPINGAVIMITTPIIVLILSAILLKEPIKKTKVFGVFMGYFFMKYAFIKKGDNLIFAFLVPFTLHGCYNLFVTSNFIVALALIFISWIVALRMFSRLKKKQKKKRKEYEKKI